MRPIGDLLRYKNRNRPVFLFAHPDDAALSAFSALWNGKENALDIVVCARQPYARQPGQWDLACGFRSPQAAHATRFNEHQQACQQLGISSIALSVVDVQYGGSPPSAWVAALNAIIADARDFQATTFFTHTPSSVHPDHRRVVRLAIAAARELGTAVIHTCDRPYFNCKPFCAQSILDRKAGSPGTVCLDDGLWTFKKQTISIYESQHRGLRVAFGHCWDLKAHLGFECYWQSREVQRRADVRRCKT
jgi:LmbE family N-acetylglucosaminyl deacetylase